MDMPAKAPFSVGQYERMAGELQKMSEMIRARPEMNHHFADRLAVLAREMREDEARVHPEMATPSHNK
jgi:hypothetical protein